MTATNQSHPPTPSSAWKIHPWAWAALVLSVGCFLVVAIKLGSLFVASDPCRIELRVEPNLSPEFAWQPLDPLAAWPVDRPVFDVSVWDDDRHRLALTRMVGKEAERIELSLHFGREDSHASATMRWY